MALTEGDQKFACSLNDLDRTGKHRVQLDGRNIIIIRVNQDIYALESFCYHAGGPLYNGDIEELGGRWCIVCPWHKYKVCLNTGQNYYQSVDPHNLSKPPAWTAGDVRQRTHTVNVRDGNVYLTLSSLDKQYCYECPHQHALE